jgi:hypothetical protein
LHGIQSGPKHAKPSTRWACLLQVPDVFQSGEYFPAASN